MNSTKCRECGHYIIGLYELEELQQATRRYKKLRKLNARQFTELFQKNLKESTPFDELVDNLPG